MFAFALWDRREERLTLAQGSLRHQAALLLHHGAQFLFLPRSPKPSCVIPISASEIDRRRPLEYFTFQNFFTDRTLLKRVRMFPPAAI